MRTYPVAVQLTVVLAVPMLLGSRAFCQRPNPLPTAVGIVNPLTGVPSGAGGPSGINPATGLPVAQPSGGARTAPGPALRLNPGAAGVIDPATGLPLPAPGTPASSAPASYRSPLDQARELINQGQFEAALQYYLSYHIQSRVSATNGPLVLALPDWVELGRRYPKAKQALLGIRDDDTREFVEGRGEAKLFNELADINQALGEPDATYALFLGLEHSDPTLAMHCYFILEPALVERGEYELCARHFGNPQSRFDIYRQSFEMTQGLAQQQAERRQQMAGRLAEVSRANGTPPPHLPAFDSSDILRKSSTDSFVRNVNQLLEILVGTGRKVEAEKLCQQAVTALDDPRWQSAVTNAELRVQAVQASPRPAPAPIVTQPQLAEGTLLFPTEAPVPLCSREHWSPSLSPDTKPDLLAILSEGKDLAANNHYPEALQRFLWYFNHALEYDPEGQRGVRLSSAVSAWVELGRKYLPAREALLEIRNGDLYQFGQGHGTYALFKDIAAINEQWGQDRTTCRLFQHLKSQDPELARKCYPLAEAALAKNGEYALCLAYIGDGQQRFAQHRQNWERLAQWEQHMNGVMQQARAQADEYLAQQGQQRPPGLPRFGPPPAADNLFVANTRQLIEILVGAGQKMDAEAIGTQALALLDDERLKSAISDAEKKLSQ